MFKKILIPIDGTDKSYKGLEAACELAKKYKECTLYILSVFYHHSLTEGALFMTGNAPVKDETLLEPLSTYAKEIVLKSEKKALQSGLKKEHIKGYIQEGHSSTTILNFAQEHNIDLIIVQKHEEHGFVEYLFGGTSLEVAKESKCAVLIL